MEKILDKIRKLLALARNEGATEHEAANALAKAQMLMMQHDISHVDEVSEAAAVRGSWMHLNRGDKWEMLIASGVAKLFNCRSVHRGGDHQFVGKPQNVEVCETTVVWVYDQVEALYKQALKAYRHKMGSLSQHERGDFRTTFKEACALRIYHRAAEIVAAARNTIPDHMALVVIDQSIAAADDLLAAASIKKGRAMKLRRSGFGTGAGFAAGDQVKLQQEVKD